MKSTISGPLQITKPVPNKKTTIINLSDEKLTLDETSLLSLGLKFTPTPKNDPTTDTTAKSNLQPHLQLALKNLKTKTQRLKILPADKGNSIAILTHKQYHDKVQPHIDEGPYTELSKDPTSTLPSKLNRILKCLLTDNKITKSFYDSCRNLHPRSPQLYGTPKIHKVNCPIRPIVSFYNTPLIALHKTLAHYLKSLSNRYLTVTTYHSHSPPIGTYVTCSQKRRLNHHLTPLAMSFIKYHAKTATPHTVVKHVAHFT